MTAEQLRNSILQEAISGRLVPQDPNDEPAANLLIKTATFRKNALQNKLIRKPDAVWEPITDDEKFMELPSGWAWARLGELGMYRKGPFGSSLTKAMFVPKSDTSYKVYEQKNAIQKDYRLGEYYISKAKFDSMQSFIVNSGDIIVSCAGTIGETYVIPEGAPIGIINQALMRVKLYDNNLVDYWLLFFEYIVMTNTELKGNGSAIKNIPPFDILKNLAIPIPPLAEQQRIISKFKELLPIVEQYGKAQKELDELNAALPARLRQSILQEAISGRLVPQDPNDEPIAKMLNTFGVKTIESEEDTPAGWSRIRMGEATEFINGLAFKPEEWKEAGLPIVRIQNLSNPHQPLHYTDKEIPEKFIIDDGQLLFSWSATLDAFIWNRGKACLNQHIFKLVPQPFIDKIYLYYLLKAIVEEYKKVTHGSTMKHITKGIFENYEILLPPLAEQQRIVAKIEELFEQIEKISK